MGCICIIKRHGRREAMKGGKVGVGCVFNGAESLAVEVIERECMAGFVRDLPTTQTQPEPST